MKAIYADSLEHGIDKWRFRKDIYSVSSGGGGGGSGDEDGGDGGVVYVWIMNYHSLAGAQQVKLMMTDPR